MIRWRVELQLRLFLHLGFDPYDFDNQNCTTLCYGKEKFDSERKEEAEIKTKISFDSPILKKRNKQSFIVEWQMGNSWKIAISAAK